MNKFEIMATFFAVFGVLMLIGCTGAVETNQWILALALFLMGTCTMFLSIVCQQRAAEQNLI